jgi:UDP-galactopyranose mutase
MWGIPISKLDVDVLKRVGVIPSYKHNYFPHDQYQGIPNAGFTEMIKKMLNHKLIKLIQRKPQIKLLKGKIYIDHELISDSIFYCGELDKLLNYRFGKLPYRSLYFKFITYKKESFQSASVINYPNHPKLTRITEYKKINNQIRLGVTTISYEYPGKYIAKSLKFSEPYYPIHNSQNNKKYQKYVKALSTYSNFHLLGRLAEYKYFDMDDVVDNAMKKFKNFVTK